MISEEFKSAVLEVLAEGEAEIENIKQFTGDLESGLGLLQKKARANFNFRVTAVKGTNDVFIHTFVLGKERMWKDTGDITVTAAGASLNGAPMDVGSILHQVAKNSVLVSAIRSAKKTVPANGI